VLGGDEMGRTQRGNNNAYCQDNDISWLTWEPAEHDRDLLAFARRLIQIFHSNPVLRRRSFFTGRSIPGEGTKDLVWIRPDGQEMTDGEWNDPANQALGMLIDGHATDEVDERGHPIYGDTLLLLLNGGNRSRFFQLPVVEGGGTWEELVDTSRPDGPRPVKGKGVNLIAHSLILLRFSEL
jgi:isoamylase